jgi:hypothetical protein
LYSEILFYTRYIFVFGNSFLHPLYFCIRIFFFKSNLFLYSEIPFYPRLFTFCSALQQHIDDNDRVLMSLCRTRVGLIYILCQIYTRDKISEVVFPLCFCKYGV